MIPRERALATFRKTFADFGFVPIETPHIERMEVLTGKGAGSEEVLRQIYSVTNKGGEPGELALRFDLTVPLARFVAKHINELGRPFKRYAIGSVFRGERPAKGRFREFVQCDFDTVGTVSPLADAETALVIHSALANIGVPAFTITLNNRKILDGMLAQLDLSAKTGSILRALDKLAKIGPDGVHKELEGGRSDGEGASGVGLSPDQSTRILDFASSGRGGVEVLAGVEARLGSNPSVVEGVANLRMIFELLGAAGVPSDRLRIDLGLARGLDYYTGVVYETTVDGWEKFGSIASGGRYDNLTRLFTDQPLPGVGASIGLDRLLALLEEAGWAKGPSTTVPVLVPNFPGADPRHAFALAARLRTAGVGAEVYPDAIQLGKQLQYGSTKGHRLAVIVGPTEQESSTFNLRDLATREERQGPALGRPGKPSGRSPGIGPEGGRPMNSSSDRTPASERPIPLARGTTDWLPEAHARLLGLESSVLGQFERAGYRRLKTPVIEPIELHERKSGAGIVGKLFELNGPTGGRACLRPELTAGIVRAYAAAEEPPALPWRVSHSGPAFRREPTDRPDRLREFHQVGLERLGDSGVLADAEVIALAWSSVEGAGVRDAMLRVGHVGLTLELLGRSGLPPTAQASLVERLSEAAAEGGDVGSLGRGLDHFGEWLRQAGESDDLPLAAVGNDDGGVDRLFRTLVPIINGRRPGREIIERLRRKWDHGHAWLEALDRVRDQVAALSELKGPPGEVLDRLSRDFEELAPDSVASLRALIGAIEAHRVPLDRVELDLGFGRGIGFYSQVVFDIVAPTSDGPVEVCGGGRYDGLARVFGSDRDDRGVGFAFGLERLDAVLAAQGHRTQVDRPSGYLVVPASTGLLREAVEAAALIRSRGVRAILEANWQGQAIEDRARALGVARVVAVGASKGETYLLLLDDRGQKARRVRFEGLPGIAALLDEESHS